MIKIEFSQTERKALHYERYHHPHPHVQKKMEVLGSCGKIKFNLCG